VTLYIHEAMNATARAAWSAVADGDDLGLRLREDTVTEGALLHLARRFPVLVLQKFSQTEEKSSGGDWQWFVGSRSQGWIAFRLQAKRMDALRYRQLDHGGQFPGEKQYDTLIRDSSAAHVPTFPFHVFFNGWSSGWPKGIAWNACPRGTTFPNCVHHEMSDLGCSLLPATVVRDLHQSSGKKRLHVATYLPRSVPWSWLFGPPRGRTGAAPGPVGAMPIFDVAHLLAWHETLAEALSQTTASDASSSVVLRDRWAEVNAHGAAAPRGRPAERLPVYADRTLRYALRERLRRERIGGRAIEAWESFLLDDEQFLAEGQQPFSVPAELNGLMFTPLPEA
jgi:hypothetical protein